MGRITWCDKVSGEKAQFIADVFNESLFDYAFDSNKVPSLNLHYFCMDYIATYNLVKEGIMKEGNMIPLNEEFECILSQSPWLPKTVNSTLLCYKDSNGNYKEISKDKNLSIDKKSDYYCETAKYICSLLNSNKNYFVLLLEQIESIFDSNTFGSSEKEKLYFCIREYICELINTGICKQHIYNQVQNILFTKKDALDSKKYIFDFLNAMLPKEDTYNVLFGISDEIYKEFKSIVKSIRTAKKFEQKRLKSNYIIEIDINALDPVSALMTAKESFNIVINSYNTCMHSSDLIVNINGLVKKEGKNHYSIINDSNNLLKKNKSKTKSERDKWLKIATSNNISPNLFGAFELHNNAITISDPQTQLLTLWTVFELLIDSKQSFMNRVNYISNNISSVLCNSYHKQCVITLCNQIAQSRAIESIINSEPRGNNLFEKFAYILKDNTDLQKDIKSNLSDYPLEIYKLEKYIDVFSSTSNLQKDLNRHGKRIKWQIMRIYRNRCMIVHNGSSMPYINGIIENLHFYIDEIFEHLMKKSHDGMSDVMSSFYSASITEQLTFEKLKDNKNSLSDQDFIDTVFDHC